MVLSFNKDNKNVGTVSERVFAGRNSPSVTGYINVKTHDVCHSNVLTISASLCHLTLSLNLCL